MVLLSASLSSALALMGMAPSAMGAVLKSRVTSDTSTWEKYHATNDAFSRTGNCMIYLEPTARDGSWACGPYCQNDQTRICTGPPTDKIMDYLINYNPEGTKWVTGKCDCNTKSVDSIATHFVDFTAKGLDEGFRKLPALFCSTYINMSKEIIEYGSYLIPGGGQAAAAAKAMAKGVKLATKSEEGQDKWVQAVADSCSIFDFSTTGNLNEAYHILAEAPDEILEEEDTQEGGDVQQGS